ncbi:hypothetical protein TWF481_011916 [Arthrobotrys musiformis]|uniref:Uncharacterized protein n=1 Tax=Arthrobotrys musiformis TaxID=47236 RepID=A0AAV9VVN1_9PEZI
MIQKQKQEQQRDTSKQAKRQIQMKSVSLDEVMQDLLIVPVEEEDSLRMKWFAVARMSLR